MRSTSTLLSIGGIQILILLVNLGRSKSLSVLLGPAGFGIVATIDQLVVLLVQLSSVSVQVIALKFMSRSHSESAEAFQRTYASFVRLIGGLGLVGTLVAEILLVANPGLFGAELAPYREYIVWAIAAVPANMLNICFMNALAAAKQATASAVLNLAFRFCLALSAVAGYLWDRIGGLFWASSLTGAIFTVASLFYVGAKAGASLRAPGAGAVQEIRRNPQIVSYAVWLYFALSAYGIALWAARYATFALLGATPAGLMQAALSIALTVTAILGPMNALYLTPLVNRETPVLDRARAAHEFTRKTIAMLLAISLPIVLFPETVVSTLFAGTFRNAAPAIGLFVLSQGLDQVVSVYRQLLIGVDDVRACSLITCFGYATGASLLPVLIPRLGLAGVALALAAAAVLNGAGTYWRLHRKFGAAPPLAILRFTLVTFVILLAASPLLSGWTELSLAGIVTRAAYALAACSVLWGFLTPRERSRAARLFSGLVPRP